MPGSGCAVDIGCGLGAEAGHLAASGWRVVGIDVSATALVRAAAEHVDAAFLKADVRRLPFRANTFDATLDRGCFHYLAPGDRQTEVPSDTRSLQVILARLSTRAPPLDHARSGASR